MSQFKKSLTCAAVALGMASQTGFCMETDSTPTTQPQSKHYQQAENAYRQQAKALLAQLSLDEKLDLLAGPGMDLTTYAGNPAINLDPKLAVEGVAGYINGVKNDAVDIPAIKLADGPAGLRIKPTREGTEQTFYATSWPIGSLLASSWDTALVEAVGKAEGDEVKRYGVDFLLAPGMNIQRNPLLGRNFEYYSEDPVIAGKMAAAIVRGVQSNGVGATIKHFAANNAETNRFFSDSIVEPRVLREIYLRGFQIAVTEAQPWAVMSSYNLLNGQYTGQRKDLLTDVLRHEWGFNGLVMSDWFASNVYGLATDFRRYITDADHDSAAMQIKAGNDLIEPGGLKQDLKASYQRGELTDADIDRSALAILTQIQKTPSFKQLPYHNDPDLVAHGKLARQAAAEGMVLLKNSQQALPYASGSKLASFGTVQINTLKGGTGSGEVNSAHAITIAEGLAEPFKVNSQVSAYYQSYWQQNKHDQQGLLSAFPMAEEPTLAGNTELQQLIAAAAKTDDAAVITLGRQAGEGEDRTQTRGDYLLSEAELALIDAVSTAFHAQGKTATVVLNINGLVDTHEWQDKVDSILLAYMGGQQTGYAVADILSGKVNPSGKLAQTIPVRYQDVPSAASFPGKPDKHNPDMNIVHYDDGLLVGYRYYSTKQQPVAYPFGFGLSYTQFSYGDIKVSHNSLNQQGAAGKLSVSANISNSGKVAGKEVVELYVAAPQTKLTKPAYELKAFSKTQLLPAGKSEKVQLTVTPELLASFDPSRDAWVVEAGDYQLYVAPSSDVSKIKPLTVHVDNEIVVSTTTHGALAMVK
ncbi:glycoside hydrolase family 3 C-terminal domain-containing protein [Shewanella avicenniae]|uniref:Glycoside hydrolase family 3 C-terminal domain-containing protein n=1 Tax=Shewanella avicenniae TaxID=2814294 RepID=A0ABX7QTD8_9GAMM|nr:glycoside hydrolase family 3 C-terminal domain-containing protein [Shewanella avicenniae]QSX34170.1 glycoside hydrolase family 3 C-terminal domain-containing protein [Shewanella avicenniae]